mgnify:CR=1 FL=1
MTRVDHVEEHVGLFELLEGRLEGRHELMGELADEAHGIGEDEGSVGRARDEPGRRIESDEEPVGSGVLRSRQVIEQGGLAGIGIADEGDHGHPGRLAPVAEEATMHAHSPELAADLLDAMTDHAAIGLELRFTRAPRADTPAQPLQMLPLPDEAREEIRELGELDLQLALHGPRALGEDVEDERGAVDDLEAERPAEIALLHGESASSEIMRLAPSRSEEALSSSTLPLPK